MKKIITLLFAAVFTLTGCQDLFTPELENNPDLDLTEENPVYALALLANAYTRSPYSSQSFNDVATDDAVINQTDNGYLKMATGSWSSTNNAVDQWSTCKAAIQYINIFLSKIDDYHFSDTEIVNEMFRARLEGEAYGLRAMYMFYLLQAHAGYAENGQLLGVPIVNDPEDKDSEFNIPRNTFQECIDQIYSDVDKALQLLPWDFQDIYSDSEVPSNYAAMGVAYDQYNRCFGSDFKLRMTGRIARAFRAKAALLAASPAFNSSSSTDLWADAADFNGEILDNIGGIAGLCPDGNDWYSANHATEIENLEPGESSAEMLWREAKDTGSYGLEQNNYPSSMYGGGQVNPTQNLVDAFPMANGYPITDVASGYNASEPYLDRDPRLSLYICYNGTVMGATSTKYTIDTSTNSASYDGINKEDGTSTRTGYYMRKHLREDVLLTSVTQNGQPHCTPRIRYTEIFLNYAEAANEAWGPMGTGSHAYSAYDVIKAIRERAGVGTENGDAYLESIKNDQDKMRELIRNERRLELCFEGFRFWDLRRWNVDLTEPAKGMSISTVGGATTYTVINVENRNFSDYQHYGPIPRSEILKFSALVQNKGW